VGGEIFSAPIQTGPGAHPASCKMGTGSFPGVKSDRGVRLTPHPFVVAWSRKGRAIPLLPLWAVRPVQSLSACIRVHLHAYEDGIECFETSAYKIQTPGNYPEENIQHTEHGESLKSRNFKFMVPCIMI